MPSEWDELPNDDWSDAEADLFWDLAESSVNIDDPYLQTLFHEAFFDTEIPGDSRAIYRDAIEQYVLDTYGIDWYDEIWDWEAWREAYGEAA